MVFTNIVKNDRNYRNIYKNYSLIVCNIHIFRLQIHRRIFKPLSMATEEELREKEKAGLPPEEQAPQTEAESPPAETEGGAVTEEETTVTEETPEGEQEALWKQRVREYFPDREFEGEEDMSAAAEEMIDNLYDEHNKGREASEKLAAIFESEPSVADFIADLLNGASLPAALAKNIDIDEITPMEDDPDYAEWEEAKKERMKKLENEKKFQEELTANKVESSKNFDQFTKDHELSEEEADAFINKIDQYLDDIYRGKVTKEFLDAMYTATGHDEEVAKARQEGELSARNEQVEEKRKEYEKPVGDGIPEVSSTSGPEEKPQKKKPRFIRALDEIEDRQRRRI